MQQPNGFINYQDVPENLFWYLGAFQDIFQRGLVEKGCDQNILNHDLNFDVF